MIILMGHLYLAPADVAAFCAAVKAITPVVQAEPGCLFYSLVLEDAATGRMLLAQRWQDSAALATHLTAPSTLAFQRQWMGRLTSDLAQYVVTDAG